MHHGTQACDLLQFKDDCLTKFTKADYIGHVLLSGSMGDIWCQITLFV